MTKQEILQETITFYGEDPKRRAYRPNTTSSSCKYYDEKTGNMCAVGRCLSGRKAQEFEQRYSGSAVLEVVKQLSNDSYLDTINSVSKSFDEILQEKYRGCPVLFWRRLQMIHDMDDNFGSDGFTNRGKNNIHELCCLFDDLDFDKLTIP